MTQLAAVRKCKFATLLVAIGLALAISLVRDLVRGEIRFGQRSSASAPTPTRSRAADPKGFYAAAGTVAFGAVAFAAFGVKLFRDEFKR